MSTKAREQFYYNMATMLEAGVDIRRAVQTQKPRLSFGRKMLEGIKAGVAAGQSLTETLGHHPRQFPAIELELIDAGERSGNLNEMLRILSGWLTFKRQMFNLFMMGMWRPILLIHGVAFIPGLFLFLFGSLSLSRYLMGAWGILSFFYIPAGILYFILKMTPKDGPVRLTLDSILTRIPVLGQALKTMALSLFCRGFRMLLRSGIMIDEAIEKAAQGCGNSVICRRLVGGGAKARLGEPASSGFKPGLPVEFMEAWWVGEETGSLDTVAERLANNFTEESQRKFRTWNFWFPMIIYLIVVMIVGAMIAMMWSRMYGGIMNTM